MNSLPVARWSALLGYVALILTLLLRNLLFSGWQPLPLGIALVILLTPLAFALRGMIQGRAYTHAWTSFLALAYFVFGVWNGAAQQTRWYGLAIVLSSLLLFVGCIFYSRLAAQSNP